ncbi:HET-domain-containing protein [Nemania sp. FL0031]|nr:HET-domain-containing protein [Nemania sp. FL0031]
MTSIADAPAQLPCADCRAIVPDRGQMNEIENSRLKTLFNREDLYPMYPSIALSAQAGCKLCALVRQRLTASIPREDISSIEESSGRLIWAPHERQKKQLSTAWDRRVTIQAVFDFTPYTAGLSPSSPAHHEEISTHRDEHQRGGAVTSLWISYRPIAGALHLVDGNPWSGYTFEFPVFDSIDLNSPRSEWRRQLPSSATLSDDNVTKIKHWINECLESHPQCFNAQAHEYWIPSRLLEINHGDLGLRIRLVESSDLSPRNGIKFAALSHVWGNQDSSPPLRLLSSNIYQFKDGIKVSELPKNFVDAAQVCARLELRYLWIDSLCIIQNSLGDWREQAALMHLVYRYALITIVATSATSCHGGFLKRSIDSVPAVKVAYSLLASEERPNPGDSYMIIYDYDNPQDSYHMFAINGSKWNTRAWTMQERSLSTRMVHFCRNKIFFECRGCLQSEENEPTQESDTINSTLWPRDASVSFEEFYQHWQLFVGEYTSRNLTVSTDKLPAIQSVAEEMMAVTEHKYIRFAGMWRDKLQRELLWNVSFGRAERLDVWRAPSWSWAAVEGQISLWQRDFRNSQQCRPDTLLDCLAQHSFEVLDIDQEYPDPQSADPGFLKVRSLVKRIDLVQKHAGPENGRSFFPYDLSIENPSNDDGIGNSRKTFAFGKLDVEDLMDLDTYATAPGMFLYLHVNSNARATGLILRAQTYDQAKGPCTWRRIGIATLFLDRSETPILNDAFSRSDVPQVTVLI